MQNMIMFFSGIVFAVLFLFLTYSFLIYIISWFIFKKIRKFSPHVSVVIPAYNEEDNIKECLECVLASSYPKDKLEIIVVDDGSKDSTREIVRSFGRIRLLRQRHVGKVAALNYGAKAAKHDFVVTIDADTNIDKDCVAELVKPFRNPKVGATTGNNRVKNRNTIIGMFQNVEYHYNNLIRSSFAKVFANDSIWFSGSMACYRKKALAHIMYFKKDTMAEDQDVALELKARNYVIVNTPSAFGYTVVPSSIATLYRQRARWSIGTTQAINKNKKLLSKKMRHPTLFLYISHMWWSIYAFLSLPLIIYQINYWLPYNSQSILSLAGYFIRWFTIFGPIYVIYKIPEWGISAYTIFGVMSGLITFFMCISAVLAFKDNINWKNLIVILLYFPFTIVLNTFILISLLSHRFWMKAHYVK